VAPRRGKSGSARARRAKSVSPGGEPAQVSSDEARVTDHPERVAWMGRLACVGQLAQMICERFPAEQEGELQRAARLIIVGRIIEALLQDGELSTADLARLVRTYVAQSKTCDARGAAEQDAKRHEPLDAKRPLPEGFREAVQQIYGIRLPSVENVNSDEA